MCLLMGLFSDSSFLSFATPAGRSQSVWQPLRRHLAQVRSLQAFCAQPHLQGPAFIAELLRQLQITVSYDPAELRRLPAAGAFVAVANHPNGLLDELALLHVLGQRRPDLHLVASKSLVALLPPPAQPLISAQTARRAGGQIVPALRQMVRYLHNDTPVALLAVSEEPHPESLISNKPTLANKLLAAIRVPVVPVWISTHHSAPFNWLGLVQPWLATLPLPVELLNQRGQTIQVRIGQSLSVQGLAHLPPEQRWSCVQTKVSALRQLPEAVADVAKSWPYQLPQTIAAAVPYTDMEADLAALSPTCRLVTHGPWEVYVARPAEIPHVLAEIGRLRELASRQVGEGSAQAISSDAYDGQHRHLFLYHREARCLVGACRLGKGRALLRQHGKRGFYLHSLFRLKKDLLPLLRESLELGCAFIRADYQPQVLPAALLWKGLAEYVATHPSYRYLLAPVAVSSSCSGVSKAQLVKDMSQYFLAAERAQGVRARKAYRYRPLAADEGVTSAHTARVGSWQEAQKLVAGLAPAGLAVPALLSSYLKQHVRFLGFNLDPGFTNALHGLLLLDVRELPLSTLCLLSPPT